MKIFFFFSMLLLNTYYSFGNIVYVKETGLGLKNGSSWVNAAEDLNEVLQNSVTGDTIWVASGVYKPTSTEDETISFQIPSGVKVFGGFAGNEASYYDLSQRDLVKNETILSGELRRFDYGTWYSTINSRRIILTQNVNSFTEINGFTIANAFAYQSYGGAWLNTADGVGNSSSPIIKHIIFKNNRASNFGGAIYNLSKNGGEASPIILRCTFKENISGSGGAIYNIGWEGNCSPEIIDCIFIKNSAQNGAAVFNAGIDCSPIFRNCVFTKNSGSRYSGAMENFQGTRTKIINCTFVFNTVKDRYGYGAAIKNYSFGNSNPELIAITTVTNSIFWGNRKLSSNTIDEITNTNDAKTILTNCLVEAPNLDALSTGGTPAIYAYTSSNVIFASNPQFSDILSDDYSLRCDSPARDTGLLSEATEKDILGYLRTDQPDIGAYEYFTPEQNKSFNSDFSNVNQKYYVSEHINATNTIRSFSNLTYSAGRGITLSPGFEVKEESTFIAKITPFNCLD